MIIDKKEDLRVKKTKKTIKESFIELAGEIGYQRITVKELCDRSMINRNTFYLHYENKDDLVKEMINETIYKYKNNLLAIATKFLINIKNKDLEDFAKNISTLLELLYEDVKLYKIILTDHYLTGYFRSVEGTYEKSIISFLNIKSDKAQLIFRYMMSGCAGILTDWIVNRTLPIDETSKIIAKLVLENVYYFNQENKIVVKQ